MPLYNQVLAEEDLTSGIAEAAECGDGMSEIGFAHFPKDPEGSCSQVPDQLHLTRPVTRPGTRSADARVVRCADLDCCEILSNHRDQSQDNSEAATGSDGSVSTASSTT